MLADESKGHLGNDERFLIDQMFANFHSFDVI